jgi:hypothetical protein
LFVKQIQPAIERKEAENGLFLLDLWVKSYGYKFYSKVY